jgi:hypothetical protein
MKPENIQGTEKVNVSLVSLPHTGQGFQLSLKAVHFPSPEVSLDSQTHNCPESDASFSRSPHNGTKIEIKINPVQ